jgi:hypothetical protein
MKCLLLVVTLLAGTQLDPALRAQSQLPSGGLGLSDADWKDSFGPPMAFRRDAWSYRGGHLYTRSWARRDAPRGRDWNGYVESDYFVKEVKIVWPRKTGASFANARAETIKLLPLDAKPVSKSYRIGSMSFRYYSSEFLAARLFPGMAGDNYCVTPWGYGIGKFKVGYHFVRGRVSRVVVDVGEPHETSLDVCKGV